jgi:WD40 repeat protein
VTRLRFTESGGLLAAVSEDRRLTLWDVTHGDLVHDLAEHTGPIRGLALLSNQVITSSDDGSLRLWDVEAGSCHLVLHGHRAPVRDVAVTRDGRWAVSVSEDASMRLWEVKTGRCARTMRAGAGWLHGVALTDERALAAGSDMAVRVWHLAWDTPQTPPMVVRPRTSAELMDNRLQYLHWLEQVEEAWTSGHMDRALQALMAARQVPGYERAPRCLELWAAMLRNASRRRAQRAWLTASLTGHHGPITALSLDGSGHYLVSASEDATLRVFQLGTGECMMTLAGQQAAVRHMVLREDCERALTVGDDEDVLVWDVPGEQVIRRLAGHLRRVRGLCMTPDGRLAVTAGQEGRLRVWDVETGNCTANVQGLGEQVAITPDGRVLALATSGGRVRIYDVRAGKCMQVLRGHQGAVNQVVLTPDGRTAVSAGEDGTVQVFDLVRGRQKAVLKGHARSVLCVAVSCDGRHVVSGSRDRTLRVWNVDSPDEVPMRLAGHGGAVTAVCLNQDASHAVSGASDGVVRVWHLDWELETHPVAMWDERAEPCLSAFLCLEAARRPRQVRPLADRIWQDEDFSRLDHALSCWGFGWLNPDGVRQRLLQVAPAWPGPPELLKTSTHEDD